MSDIAIDMVGFRSGKLTAVVKAKGKNSKRAYWLCRCDCGRNRIVMGKYLRGREVKSCGCLNRQPLKGPRFKHGHANTGKITGTYISWSGMIQRCVNPKNNQYFRYGAQGIQVCTRWLNFENFLRDMGPRPPGKTLDRIDGTSDYRSGNCRWATPKEQSSNSSRPKFITYLGRTQNLTEWAKEIGISSGTLSYRLKKWTTEKTLTLKLRSRERDSIGRFTPFGETLKIAE